METPMFRPTAIILALGLPCLVSPTRAAEPPGTGEPTGAINEAPGAVGLFAHVGGGVAAGQLTGDGDAASGSAFVGYGAYALGLTVTDDLALYGVFSHGGTTDVSFEIDARRPEADGIFKFSAVGLGATRFWAPADVSTSFSLGLASVEYVDHEGGGLLSRPQSRTLATERGATAALTVTKTWPFWTRWGLGLGLQLSAVATETHTLFRAGLGYSLTVNAPRGRTGRHHGEAAHR